MTAFREPTRVLAIASGGGHWIQLLRLRPSWSGCDVTYASTTPNLSAWLEDDAASRNEPKPRYVHLLEANKWQKLKLLRVMASIFFLVLRFRPHIIITTGAAHGYFALRFGHMLGSRTVWIDSIANAGEMSHSGTMVKRYADVWLTQWEHVATSHGPAFQGAVL